MEEDYCSPLLAMRREAMPDRLWQYNYRKC